MGDIPKSASDRANLAMKKMEEIYQCPVCLRLPICNIYQCKEGHLVCVDCYKRLPSPQPVCPTCRTALPNPPIRCRSAEQATKYMDRPCKFANKGCKQVGDAAFIKAHMKNCNFGKIECPDWLCKDSVTYENVLDHLINTHGAQQRTQQEILDGIYVPSGDDYFVPSPDITIAHGQAFIRNIQKIKDSIMCWIVLLGTKEDAQKYEVKFIAGPNDENCIKLRAKVFSVEVNKAEVLQNHRGIIEISKGMAINLSEVRDGEICVLMTYGIVKIDHGEIE